MTKTAVGADVLVLHDVGDPAGGQRWAEALRAAGWPGEVHAPDLPGHAGTSPPESGNHESADAAYAIVPLLARLPEPPAAVVGAGVNGWNAMLCGLGARANSVVLVDGLGGPWVTPTEFVRAQRDWVREIAEDPASLAPAPSGTTDPRLRHGVPAHGSRRLALRGAAHLAVPLLVLETDASPVAFSDAEEIAAACPGGGRAVRVERGIETIAAAIVAHHRGVNLD